MTSVAEKRARLRRRHRGIRRRVKGTPERPRLAVYRSLKHIYAQVIDDLSGQTLAAASTRSKDLAEDLGGKTGTCEAASKVGQRLAERAKEAGVTQVAFDRGGRKFHGRVKALAEAAREAGLEF
jgi:large subunit ribosomal protein L18